MPEHEDSGPVRVIVVDDHPVFRRGLLAVLSDEDDVEVVAAVGTGREALAAALEQRPDVVLLDLNLGDINGIEVTKKLTAAGFPGAVLILTMYDDEVAVVAALDAGARGYLLKGAAHEEILAGIRSVGAGGMIFGSKVTTTVAERMRNPSGRRQRALGLTERETEILVRIADGESNNTIARALFLSEKTVRNHITNIFSKIGVTDRGAAARLAREDGLSRRSSGLPWESR